MSFKQSNALIYKYGDKLKGIFGMTDVATPAAADAVTRAERCSRATTTTVITMSNTMKPYVGVSCVTSVALWNQVNIGYVTAYVLHAVADSTLATGATLVKVSKIGDLVVINSSEILLGAITILNENNIEQLRLLS